jgi:hypothetical protein
METDKAKDMIDKLIDSEITMLQGIASTVQAIAGKVDEGMYDRYAITEAFNACNTLSRSILESVKAMMEHRAEGNRNYPKTMQDVAKLNPDA